MHQSKHNVYQTLVLVGGIHAPYEETSIDTFVQLASLHFSGLIAIVRSQEGRLNTDVDRSNPRVASTDTKVSPIPSSN
jgi:hypothetical protein